MNTRRMSPRDMPRHQVISWGVAASRLGVNKSHLWRVANGHRHCPRLLAAYNALLVELTSTK